MSGPLGAAALMTAAPTTRPRSRYTGEEIIAAYQRTGSVWSAGKELGLTGQTVHERLHALGWPLAARKWTDDEIAELRSLVGHMTLGEIARRLGRPYTGVAGKISQLGLAGRSYPKSKKVPRGAGYDKASLARYVKQLDASGELITRFARRNGLGVEALVVALERTFPDWWLEYRRTHSDLAEKACLYCGGSFIPSTAKQVLCSRKCGSDRRADESYFGGNRRNTIGLAEGVCQLCAREGAKGLSSHHVFGKENDPENASLIALCPGCHKLVTLLASRTFVDDPDKWETLIELAWLRKHGSTTEHDTLYTSVEIEAYTADPDERAADLEESA